MGFLPKILVAILILIAVNALAHRVPFLAAPETGSEEFGYDTSGTIEDAAGILVSLVGIGLIGFATFSVLAAWMIIKGNRGGLSVTIVLGGTYLLISIYAIFNLPTVMPEAVSFEVAAMATIRQGVDRGTGSGGSTSAPSVSGTKGRGTPGISLPTSAALPEA